MKEVLDAAAFRDIILCASAALEQNKQAINDLNVFPVPDGDTGTNMSLTMGAAASEMRKGVPDTVGAAADKTASALLRGARGNSGVILSLLFRGIGKRLKGHETADARLFAAAMSDGVEAAYNAVMKPTEGTILTVSRVATSAALEYAENDSDLEYMLLCALESAKEALADTINLNPVLKRAGVVDAGGKGYVHILEAALAVVRGATPDYSAPAPAPQRAAADFSTFSTEEIEFAFDTVYIVRKNGKPLDSLREYLESIGDSLVISEDDEMFKVHVHTNIPGDALTESQKYGDIDVAKIENMRFQHDDLAEQADYVDRAVGDGPEEPAQPEKPFGAVAVCAGEGLKSLFVELGADRVVTGGQTMNPSTEDILNEVNRTPAETVFVLPNNKNIIMAAEQCAPLTDKRVVVLPTRSVPQGISSMLCLDPSLSEDELVESMTEAMSAVHTAQITYAARDSDFDGYAIHEGEYLALLDGGLIGSYKDMCATLTAVCESLAQFEPEIISVYYGEDADEGGAEDISAKLSAAFADAEISVVDGGQPVYYYMISVE